MSSQFTTAGTTLTRNSWLRHPELVTDHSELDCILLQLGVEVGPRRDSDHITQGFSGSLYGSPGACLASFIGSRRMRCRRSLRRGRGWQRGLCWRSEPRAKYCLPRPKLRRDG